MSKYTVYRQIDSSWEALMNCMERGHGKRRMSWAWLDINDNIDVRKALELATESNATLVLQKGHGNSMVRVYKRPDSLYPYVITLMVRHNS